MRFLGRTIEVTVRCAVREQGIFLIARLAAIATAATALPWLLNHLNDRADAVKLLAVALGLGALALSGLPAQFARRRNAQRTWLRSLPRRTWWWSVADITAFNLIGIAVVAPLLVGAFSLHLFSFSELISIIASYWFILIAFGIMFTAVPEMSFAWAVIVLMGWSMIVLSLIGRIST
ncbi:hypothetical protein [Burkholderia mayonis]|uniref:Uncharacterized protein n=1 Tax=Burkholderia mayonis TaxID=1385591 RepID=A0A1B4FW82_9BURK|nr:hypothetical protein [Burkholderia mayonis]AOJ07927.1 hypothetical protein WS71_11935 [Burkholderia mayonis]KVE55431.1 hypothetical protein WS71_03030 [Burkholderia mayonis]